jgi:HSP20 family protein
MLPALRNQFGLAPLSVPTNRISSFFDRIFDEDRWLSPMAGGIPVAMWEDDDHLYVEVELPGIAEADVDVTIQNGMLFIRSERKPEEGRRYLYDGRTYGRFERVISLPEAVKTDDVQARLTHGVLHVALPKSPEARPRKITLQAS